MTRMYLFLSFASVQLSFAATAAEPRAADAVTGSALGSIAITNLLTHQEMERIAAVSNQWNRLMLSNAAALPHTLATSGTSLVLTRVLTNGDIEEITYNGGVPTSLSCKLSSGSGFDAVFFSGRLRDFTQYKKFKSANIDYIVRYDTLGHPIQFVRFAAEGKTFKFYRGDADGNLLPPVENDLSKSRLHIYQYGIGATNGSSDKDVPP